MFARERTVASCGRSPIARALSLARVRYSNAGRPPCVALTAASPQRLAFDSRDGFHFSRPAAPRTPLCAVNESSSGPGCAREEGGGGGAVRCASGHIDVFLLCFCLRLSWSFSAGVLHSKTKRSTFQLLKSIEQEVSFALPLSLSVANICWIRVNCLEFPTDFDWNWQNQ